MWKSTSQYDAVILPIHETFKTPFEDNEKDALQSQGYLVNRAIAMHLLREGQFNVATTFVHETKDHNSMLVRSPGIGGEHEWEAKNEALHRQFSDMYDILNELRHNHNLKPAIAWARQHSITLESRGSNLEFELCRLQFLSAFVGSDDTEDVDMHHMELL